MFYSLNHHLNSINNKKITVNDCPTNIYIHWRFVAIPVFSKELNDIEGKWAKIEVLI